MATSLPPGTTQDVTVQLWDAATGGNLLFAEAQTGLAVDDSGFINLAFGSQTAGGLSPTNFPSGTSRFLDVVDASSASVLAARLPLNATPFALSPGPAGPQGPPGPAGPPGPPGVVQAVTAADPSIAIGGSAANPTVAVAANSLTNAHLAADAAISPAKIAGTAATLGGNLFTGPQQINNALGIGTSPLFPLHVRGDGIVQARIQSTNNRAMLVLDSLLSPTNWSLASTGDRFLISSSNSVQSRLSIDSQGNVGINTDTPNARLQVVNLGLFGTAVSGTGGTTGVIGTGFFGVSGTGTGTGSIGVLGNGSVGVRGEGTEGTSTGVSGEGTTGVRGNGTSTGVSGTGIIGVRGEGTSSGVAGTGITGVAGNGTSNGVIGTGTGAGSIGVLGSGAGVTGIGVRGEGRTGVYGTGTGLTNFGVFGEGINGVVGTGTGSNGIGVSGFGISGSLAGRFQGNVQVTGTLTKGGGSFKIDHPLDPDNQYLSHSFVESPDMMNVYNGNVLLDPNGEAWIQLPEWFEALNRDFRYQLTSIGGFAPIYIAEKIQNNRFKIAGGQPGLEVSWQVTGIRQDAWANANRIPVEEDKPAAERGFYLHPDVYGQPEEKAIIWAQQPEAMRQMMKEARQK